MLLKICGMRRQRDIDKASQLGFQFCGFIFHSKSPRFIEPEKAATLKTGSMARTGVFVEQSSAEIMEIMQKAQLDYAQLHGNQTLEDAKLIGPDKIIKVFWPERYKTSDEFLKDCEMWLNDCSFYLLDSGISGGGSGKPAKSAFIKKLSLPKPWFLAGGISAENVKKLAEEYKPYGFDVNSCLETAPGCKSHEMMETFSNIWVRR